MNIFSRSLFLLVMAVGMLSPDLAVAQKTVVDAHLANGGVFRLKNRGSGRYITENKTDHGLTGVTQQTAKPGALSQIWILKKNDGSYSLRNAYTGRYIPAENGKPMKTTLGANKLYIKYSAANNGTTTSYVTISWDAKYEGEKCLNENNGTRYILGWKANSPSVNDKFSDWVLEPAKDVTDDEIKAQITQQNHFTKPTENAYVHIVSAAYGNVITESPGNNSLFCIAPDAGDFSQVWKLEKISDSQWALKNALTGRYIQKQNGKRSSGYKTTTAKQAYTFSEGTDPYVIQYSIEDAGGVGLHDASSQDHLLVGWDISAEASQWGLKTVTVDEAALKAKQDELAVYSVLTPINIIKIRTTLRHYFEDEACTRLKPEFQNMSDDQLRAKMSEEPTDPADPVKIAIPLFIQDMAVKVKNESWGHREKEFRIHNYDVFTAGGYSDGGYRDIIGTNFCFGVQTGPTGISVKRGDVLTIYVGATPKYGASIGVMLTSDFAVNGEVTPLQKGFNVYTAARDGFIFINYHLKNKLKKVADYPAIPIHIEGGRVNGYFDITRGHTNADWLDMEKTLFKDKVIHMQSKYTHYLFHLDRVKKRMGQSYLNKYPTMYADMRANRVDADGVPKGIQGVLQRWDSIVAIQYDLMNVKLYQDRFKGMLSASSNASGNPHASSFGTYYPDAGGIVDYYDITIGRDTDEGGNLWMLAHEIGHIHQRYINMAGCTEISNNFYSQVTAWKQGSHVGRGGPLSVAMNHFHKGNNWHEYDLWIRTRFYFQLWLYFHEMGHKPTFYQELFERLRREPMTASTQEHAPGSGKTDFLRFAKHCCDVAKMDLSEFFQFYGMFQPTKNYTVGDYTNTYFSTTQKDIDEAIAYMQKYPKGPEGLLFIDERIRKVPATYPGAPAGAMRWATTRDVHPAQASKVGDVGMYLDYRNDIEVAPYTCTVSATGKVTIQKDGKGAVGFKVYDTNRKLVYVSNTWTFNLPESIRKAGYYICVAYGNGKQQSIYNATNVASIGETVVEPADQFAVIYDLSGRRIHNPKHGVYIVNGKLQVR